VKATHNAVLTGVNPVRETFTPREQETLTMLADGKSPKEIAVVLNISYDTVLSY